MYNSVVLINILVVVINVFSNSIVYILLILAVSINKRELITKLLHDTGTYNMIKIVCRVRIFLIS